MKVAFPFRESHLEVLSSFAGEYPDKRAECPTPGISSDRQEGPERYETVPLLCQSATDRHRRFVGGDGKPGWLNVYG